MPELAPDRIALDRASVRSFDDAGHLHVAQSNISKACVSDYYGREIVDAEELGLIPDKVYRLFRDPDELAASASTFNSKPLLLLHRPQPADDFDTTITIGSVFNVQWKAPYLQAELSVWVREGIDLIESGERRELSCGYFYKADPTPGTYEGQSYDLVMRKIRGNHVTICPEGRAGSDVYVGDSKPAIERITPTWQAVHCPAKPLSRWGHWRFTSIPRWRPMRRSISPPS